MPEKIAKKNAKPKIRWRVVSLVRAASRAHPILPR